MNQIVQPKGWGPEKLFDLALRRTIKTGGLEVEYPDGTIIGYGENPENLRLAFNSTRALIHVMRDVNMLGEEFSRGYIEITQPGESKLAPPIKKLVSLYHKNAARPDNPWADRYVRIRAKLDELTRDRSDPAFHYDRGNDLYRLMLDKNLTYSCSYVDEDPETMALETAQQHKISNILNKLDLEDGHHLLDIGSGWGHLLFTAAKRHPRITAVGITLSHQQLRECKRRAKELGLANRVKFELIDYKVLAANIKPDKMFDRVVSVGMFEHVGRGQHAEYFKALNKLLKPGGVTVLHTISQQFDRPLNRWMRKYVFPGADVPTNDSVLHLASQAGFRDADLESRRRHYAWTLDKWSENLESHEKEFMEKWKQGKIRHSRISDSMEAYRSECFYLACSAASFEEGPYSLSQFIFTKGVGNSGHMTRDYMTADS